jgi:hypothetical protein
VSPHGLQLALVRGVGEAEPASERAPVAAGDLTRAEDLRRDLALGGAELDPAPGETR